MTTTPPDARNALAEIVAGEPIAWQTWLDEQNRWSQCTAADAEAIEKRGGKVRPLYAAPQPTDKSRIAALEAQVEGMRVALKPFARIADMEEHQPPAASVMVNVSRCRDARAALQSSETTGEK